LLANAVIVKKTFCVLLQNAGVMAFQIRFNSAQGGDCESLWPAVPHQPEASQKRERLIAGKPILEPATRRVHAMKGEICALRVLRTPVSAEAPVGLE